MPIMLPPGPIIARLLAALTLLAGAFCYTPSAQAATCWLSQGPTFDFGTLPVGQKGTTSAQVAYGCQGEYGKTIYFRLCLRAQNDPPFYLRSNNTDGKGVYSLQFYLYGSGNLARPMGGISSDAWVETTVSAGDNQQIAGQISLTAVLPAGQSDVPATGYYNYNLPLYLTWIASDSQDSLPSCNGAEANTVTGWSAAQATIADTCEIRNVGAMSFGSLAAANGPARLTADSTATLAVKCPAGSAFSIGLNDGLHANQGQSGFTRNLCAANGECVGYELYKNAAYSARWGNIANDGAL